MDNPICSTTKEPNVNLASIRLLFALALTLAAEAMRNLIRKIKTFIANQGMDFDFPGFGAFP